MTEDHGAGWVRTFTTAPVDYDGFGTVTLKSPAGCTERGREVRLVLTPPEHVNWQRARYQSGMHMAVDDAEWQKLVSYGLVQVVS